MTKVKNEGKEENLVGKREGRDKEENLKEEEEFAQRERERERRPRQFLKNKTKNRSAVVEGEMDYICKCVYVW